MNKSSKSMGNVCLMDHTQRITDLLAQINTFQVSGANTAAIKYEVLFQPPDSAPMCFCVQRNETRMSEDIHRIKQEKQALEVDLQLMKKERDLAKARATSASGKTGHSASLHSIK